MARISSRRQLRDSLERLESRQLLAVASVVESGLLKVSGDADGAVEIVAKPNSQFEVTDNGVSVGTFDGVKAISIVLDSSGTANNLVTLKLDGASVDRVVANLGAGDNSLILASGSIKGSLSFNGGSGKDNLELEVGTKIGRNVYAMLGDGSNKLSDGAAIAGSLLVSGGLDEDVVSILAEASIGKYMGMNLGNGANTLNVAGTVEKSLVVKTGDGNDSVTIDSTGFVGGSVSARLGAGDNSLTHSGEIAGDLRVTSKTSTDKVTVGTDAIVGGRTVQKLGFGLHRNHDRLSAVRGRR
jgi:hypothetical protein